MRSFRGLVNAASLSLAGALCLAASPLAAAEFLVNTTADAPDTNAGDGLCTGFGLPPTARCTLRAAIMEANAQGGAHEITLPTGDYVLTRVGQEEDLGVNGDLDIRADITILNEDADFPVLAQATGERLFEVHPGATLTLSQLQLQGGEALSGLRPFGGAVLVWHDALLRIGRSTLLHNRASKGGAIHSWGDVLIVESALHQNYLVDPAPDADNQGAAIAIQRTAEGPARLQIERSSLSGNGEVEVSNLVPNSYALLAEDGAEVALANSSVIDNTRGVWARGGARFALLMSTIAGNRSFGLRMDHDPNLDLTQLQVAQSVIVGNGSVTQCRSATATFLNPNLSQLQISDLFNAAGDPSCGFNGASDVLLAGWPFHPEPMLAELTRYYLPVPGRGLVDTGGPNCGFPQDQRNGSRPLNGSGQPQALCDIGAIEFDPLQDPALPDQLFGNGFED